MPSWWPSRHSRANRRARRSRCGRCLHRSPTIHLVSTSSSAPERNGKKRAKKAVKQALDPAALGLPAKPVKPRASDPPATHLRAKVDADLRAVLKYEPGTRSGVDPEDLHQMRVSTRR